MTKELNLVEILSGKNNDLFRKSTNSTNEGYIFDAPIEAAKEIVSELAKKTTRSHHVMLLAKMQSGKTSVCNAVINIINSTKLNIFMGIDKFMFISGMNDCGLKEQTYTRLKQQVIGANIDNIYIGKRSNKNVKKNKFFVMKNSDLLGYEGDINNTLIFIDESHYGSNERNVLTKFLNKHGINWKNPIDLIKRNIFIVSVSATPFDEIVSDTAECKKMVELKTDDSYVGVAEYLENDLVHDANKDDIKDGTIFDYIADAKERMEKNGVCGAIIIRTRNFELITENSSIVKDFDILELKSSNTSIDYDSLNKELASMIEANNYNKRIKGSKLSSMMNLRPMKVKPLLVLIKGAFRAGITIPANFKDYIYMIYDYSLKADTTAQALLGRMCGYRSENNEFKNTYFYLNKKFADMYSEWENDFQDREKIPFNQAKWVWVDENYKGETEIGSKSSGNIAIDLTDEEIKTLYSCLYHKRNKLAIMEKLFPRIIQSKGIDLSYDYMLETQMNGKNNYAVSSHHRRFESFTSDLLVFPFRPERIKKFCEDTNRDYLTKEDLGKKCVSLVLDTEIYKDANNKLEIKGNKRLLVYCAEVAQKALMANRDSMYKSHKDTSLV